MEPGWNVECFLGSNIAASSLGWPKEICKSPVLGPGVGVSGGRA